MNFDNGAVSYKIPSMEGLGALIAEIAARGDPKKLRKEDMEVVCELLTRASECANAVT